MVSRGGLGEYGGEKISCPEPGFELRSVATSLVGIFKYTRDFYDRGNLKHLWYIVCFLLGNSPASEFYMPTFRNTLFHLHRQIGVRNDPLHTYLPMKME